MKRQPRKRRRRLGPGGRVHAYRTAEYAKWDSLVRGIETWFAR